jgi:Na+/pantothenate symporter
MYLTRTIALVVIAILIAAFAFIVAETPILTNQVAMGQLENSNDWFVLMTMYQKIANGVSTARNVLIAAITTFVIIDTAIFVRKIKN